MVITEYSPTADRKVRKADQLLHRLAERHSLPNPSFTRWCWDGATALMVWMADSGMGRNIQAGVAPSGRFLVEANGWKDYDRGKKRVRRWQHLPLAGEFTLDELGDALERAYVTLAGWTEEDLERQDEIPSVTVPQ